MIVRTSAVFQYRCEWDTGPSSQERPFRAAALVRHTSQGPRDPDGSAAPATAPESMISAKADLVCGDVEIRRLRQQAVGSDASDTPRAVVRAAVRRLLRHPSVPELPVRRSRMGKPGSVNALNRIVIALGRDD